MKTNEEAQRYVPRQPPRPASSPGGDLERWEIDASTSEMRFTLRHIVVHEIRGRFKSWGGTLYLDRATPALSSVEVWVDLASIDTDSTERDDHVRSEEFFDVARFPRAEFESSSVEIAPEQIILRGLLTLHGVTRDIELEVGPRHGPADDLRNVYQVRGTIDRQAFGLHWNQDLDTGGIVVGDDVKIEADVEIVRAENGAQRRP